MKIDYKYSTSDHTSHFAQEVDGAFIVKVMQRQRLNRVLKSVVGEREP